MKTDVLNNLSRSLHKVGFKLKKHSPEILLVTGVVGTVASAIMACKATTKVNTILDEAKTSMNTIREVAENPEYSDQYSVEDSKKDMAIVGVQTGIKLAKLYGPAVIVGAASIGCILASHNIIHKRNVAISAAYTAISTSFKEYRGRVVERFGKELDRELKYNIKRKEVEEVVINEDGTESVVTNTVEVAEPNLGSDYARFFDESCVGWDKNSEYNLMYLRQQQRYATDKLRAEGFLLLNDVYKMLGIQPTKAGMVVGWIYDEKNPIGDNYVDFGIYDVRDERKRAFVNGYERSILLDFNVDGNIYELMK